MLSACHISPSDIKHRVWSYTWDIILLHNKQPMGCEAQLAFWGSCPGEKCLAEISRGNLLFCGGFMGKVQGNTQSWYVCRKCPRVCLGDFLGHELSWGSCPDLHVGLQVSTCNGYDLCRPRDRHTHHTQRERGNILLA